VPKFLSPVDLGGLVPPITCKLQAHADLSQLSRDTVEALTKVLELLAGL
jgi:hypothetical protein